MMDELMKEIVETWTPEQIQNHIWKLETRVVDTRSLITELKVLLRQKKRKVTPDNGVRGGK